MDRPFGFSTGAVARGDFGFALRMLNLRHVEAVELSALRDYELQPLVEMIDEIDLSSFKYISIHAPSRFDSLNESEILRIIEPLFERRWPIVVHPDVIKDDRAWSRLGDCLCLENMDKRKAIARTLHEVHSVFDRFPEATFCLDLGHARQVDPSMGQAALMLEEFSGQLRQIHLSEVNAKSQHAPLTLAALGAVQQIVHLIPQETPVILESTVAVHQIDAEISMARRALLPRAGIAVST